MNIIESLLNENIKLSYKKKLKESPSKKVYIVTKDGKYYPMDRYKANKWLVDNGIEDFVVRPGKDSEGNPVDYFYCKEDSKLKVNEGIKEKIAEVTKFIDYDGNLCFSIERNDNPDQDSDYVEGFDLWREYETNPTGWGSGWTVKDLIKDIDFLKQRGFKIIDSTDGELFNIIDGRR